MSDPSLEKLLRPRSVAVVGASAREGSTGLRLIRHLQMGGFAGPIYATPATFDCPGVGMRLPSAKA